MDDSHVDSIISQLCGAHDLTIWWYEYMIKQLCPIARNIFSTEPSLLDLQAPIKIAGDLQYTELRSIFRHGGCPPKSNYLFMGNYVAQQENCLHKVYGGRPPHSNNLTFGNYVGQRGNCLRTILLLLAFKIRYPKNLFMVKGNSDAVITNFCVDEIDEMCHINSTSERVLYDCLNSLPVAALINDKIICTHGGLSPDLHNLDQIRHIKRTDLPHSQLLLDLLGPHSCRHVRNLGDIFVAEEVQFLDKHDLRLICCGLRQVVSNYKDFAEHRVVSISSPPYSATKTDITMMSVDANLKCTFHNLRRKKAVLWSYQIIIAATIQKEIFQATMERLLKRVSPTLDAVLEEPSLKANRVPPSSISTQQACIGASPLGSSALLVPGCERQGN